MGEAESLSQTCNEINPSSPTHVRVRTHAHCWGTMRDENALIGDFRPHTLPWSV